MSNYKLTQEYAKFIAGWLKYAVEMWNQNPDNLTGYRLGHDWNSDRGIRIYKGEILPITNELDYVIQEFISLIVMMETPKEEIERIVSWLENWDGGSPFSGKTPAVKAVWGIHYAIKLGKQLEDCRA
jgi:hypothetical protein